MEVNVGTTDRMVCIVAGMLLLALAIFGSDIPFSWIGWIGIGPLLTAAIRSCPAYSLIGVNTCSTKAKG